MRNVPFLLAGVCLFFAPGCVDEQTALLNKANSGDAEAQYQMGLVFSEGEVVTAIDTEAFKWFEKSAKQGHTKAQNKLGEMYDRGQGVDESTSDAAEWFRRSAKQALAEGQWNLGRMLETGRGVEQDLAEAVKWYRMSADQLFAKAEDSLGRMYEEGQGIERDWIEAEKLYGRAASRGLAEAEYHMGELYRKGRGTGVFTMYSQNAKNSARVWYLKAAKKGHAAAQYQLGITYFGKDDVLALRWIQKAVDQGHRDAQVYLGRLYEKGEGVPQSMSEAKALYRIAANRGSVEAIRRQAELCRLEDTDNRKGGNAKAVSYYQKAAELGDLESQLDLANAYLNGQGVEKNDEIALEWFRRAAGLGDMAAQESLASMLLYRKEFSKGISMAIEWQTRAALNVSRDRNVGRRGSPVFLYFKGVVDEAEIKSQFQSMVDSGNAQGMMLLGLIHSSYWRGETKWSPVERKRIDLETHQPKVAVEWFRKAAKQGNALACYCLGDMTIRGEGTAVDRDAARKWFQLAIEKGIPEAERHLESIDRNENKLRWMVTEAESGKEHSQIQLARSYQLGSHGEQDFVKAVKWYQKGADQGSTDAMYLLGECYQKGEGVDVDLAQAIEWYQEAAEQYHTQACFALGTMHEDGLGVPQNQEEAEKWYLEGVSNRMRNSRSRQNKHHILAQYFEHGQDRMKRDPIKAVKWYRRAADEGDVSSMYQLAKLYEMGEGVDKDSDKAIEWYTKAAEAGHRAALLTLGTKYFYGSGDFKDVEKGLEWYRKAAEAGYHQAIQRLAEIYEKGLEVEKDPAEAVKWYRMLAETGRIEFQYKLGQFYEAGFGVEKDIEEAKKWYQKSANGGGLAQRARGNGYQPAQAALKRLGK